jgi:catechol 2,3-dioxygenase-like lactoylglutathione lyase family enzyme
MSFHLRIARPVTDLARSVEMYVGGLGLLELARFDDHAGFDGAMLGRPGLGFHLEFTRSRHHRITPSPTAEDLLVIYLPDHDEWRATCARMLEAGFAETPAFNPYWAQRGRTFVDADGYRVVLENDRWSVR